MTNIDSYQNQILSTAQCLFRSSKVLPFVRHRIELSKDAIDLFEENDFDLLRGGKLMNYGVPSFKFEITPIFYVIDTKLKHNRKHRGFHRVTFYDGVNNEHFSVFYTSREKSSFKSLLKNLKHLGIKVIFTSLNASFLY